MDLMSSPVLYLGACLDWRSGLRSPFDVRIATLCDCLTLSAYFCTWTHNLHSSMTPTSAPTTGGLINAPARPVGVALQKHGQGSLQSPRVTPHNPVLPFHLRRALVAALAAALFSLSSCSDSSARAKPGEAVVKRVVDGDTIVITLNGDEEKIRFIGIDTPETHGPGGLRECWGEEATHEMEQLLPPGTVVRIVRDKEARDRYGRLLAYVYRSSDDLFVNLEQIVRGNAVAKEYPPNITHSAELKSAENDSQTANVGLWATCGGADVALN